MKRVLPLLLALLLLAGCTKKIETQYYMMDTVMTFTLYGENAKEAERALSDRVAALEKVFSPTDAESELVTVNRAAGTSVQVSEDFASLLDACLAANTETEGAFDPTLGAVIDLWNKETVPSAEELSQCKVGCDAVRLEGTSLQTETGIELNFGAAAKGYASDCAKEILEENGIEHALLSLGGNVYAHGGKPNGEPWMVGVRDPNGDASEWLGVVQIKDGFLIASGDYERYFEQNGFRYHHILDPLIRTPAMSDLRECVIIGENGTRGDILSTALFVMGYDRAVEYWREHRDFEMILVREDNAVLVTEGISSAFTLTGEEYTLEVIE